MSLPANMTYDDIYYKLDNLGDDVEHGSGISGEAIADFIERLYFENEKLKQENKKLTEENLNVENKKLKEENKKLKEENSELYDPVGARECCDELGLVLEEEYTAMNDMYKNSQYHLKEAQKSLADEKLFWKTHGVMKSEPYFIGLKKGHKILRDDRPGWTLGVRD